MPFNRRNSAAKPTSMPNTSTRASAGAREGRAHDQEFTGENSERRQSGNRDDAEDQRPAEHWMAFGETAHIGDPLRAFDLRDMTNREKDRRFGERMHGHVQKSGEIGERSPHTE